MSSLPRAELARRACQVDGEFKKWAGSGPDEGSRQVLQGVEPRKHRAESERRQNRDAHDRPQASKRA